MKRYSTPYVFTSHKLPSPSTSSMIAPPALMLHHTHKHNINSYPAGRSLDHKYIEGVVRRRGNLNTTIYLGLSCFILVCTSLFSFCSFLNFFAFSFLLHFFLLIFQQEKLKKSRWTPTSLLYMDTGNSFSDLSPLALQVWWQQREKHD